MDENEKLPDVLRLKVDVILEPIRKWWDGQDGRGAYFGSLEDARENLNHRVDIARDEIIKFGTDMFRLGREMLEKQQADHQKDLGDLSGLGQIPDPEPLKPGLGMEHALLRIEKAISNTPQDRNHPADRDRSRRKSAGDLPVRVDPVRDESSTAGERDRSRYGDRRGRLHTDTQFPDRRREGWGVRPGSDAVDDADLLGWIPVLEEDRESTGEWQLRHHGGGVE